MQTILVTGGAGFIGSNFIHYMRQAHPEYTIVNLDALTYAGNLENLSALEHDNKYQFVKGNICDRTIVRDCLERFSVDAVVHFAAESHVDRSISGADAFVVTNVVGTQVMLDCARAFWQSSFAGKRFVHVSTDEVYGSLGPTGFFTEETPLAPNSPYSASKTGSDLIARAYFHTYGLPVLITRCSNNYGPYQFPEKLIPLMITNALRDLPLPVYGDGKNVRDWLYVVDHCRAVDCVLHKGVLGEVYNIGGFNEWHNIDIVKLVLAQLNKPESLIRFVTDRLGHDRRYAIDASKIRMQLGWTPTIDFTEGIRQTIRWYCDNQAWWQKLVR
ncbi:MAG: dTDP-glucose 4,6-dehydratase [Chitinivibrionales bacterium]|nr:dTDP-glucose 4,6-dehydratase [Chitinivibrionales bacterium]